jgi:hypothetical protein
VKLLFILFDLGSEENSIAVSYSSKSSGRLVHSKGYDEVFGCSDTMTAQKELQAIFSALMILDRAEDIAVNIIKIKFTTSITIALHQSPKYYRLVKMSLWPIWRLNDPFLKYAFIRL